MLLHHRRSKKCVCKRRKAAFLIRKRYIEAVENFKAFGCHNDFCYALRPYGFKVVLFAEKHKRFGLSRANNLSERIWRKYFAFCFRHKKPPFCICVEINGVFPTFHKVINIFVLLRRYTINSDSIVSAVPTV